MFENRKIGGSKMMTISEQDEKAIKEFASWLCNKYEVFEPEEDGYTLYSDMKYHSLEDLLNEYLQNK